MTIVFKAAGFGLTELGGPSSWTSSIEHARLYMTSRFAGFGGSCLYSVVVAGPVLDLRAGAPDKLLDVGVDLDDYQGEPLHDTLRALERLVRQSGFDWVTFCEHPTDAADDEWLHVGDRPLMVTYYPGHK